MSSVQVRYIFFQNIPYPPPKTQKKDRKERIRVVEEAHIYLHSIEFSLIVTIVMIIIVAMRQYIDKVHWRTVRYYRRTIRALMTNTCVSSKSQNIAKPTFLPRGTKSHDRLKLGDKFTSTDWYMNEPKRQTVKRKKWKTNPAGAKS